MLLIGYGRLYRYLINHSDVVRFDWIWLDLGFPALIAAIVLFTVLKYGIRLLKFDLVSGDWKEFYYVIAFAAMALPTIIATHYLKNSEGELISVEHPEQILASDTERFFRIPHFGLDKGHGGMYYEIRNSGRHNQYLSFGAFVCSRLEFGDTLSSDKIWVGVRYYDKISSRSDSTVRSERFEQFAAESKEKYKQAPSQRVRYFEKVLAGRERDNYIKAIGISPIEHISKDSLVILQMEYEPFKDRGKRTLSWLYRLTIGSDLLWFIMLIFPGMRDKETDTEKRSRKQVNGEMWKILIPSKELLVIPIVFHVNLLVFLAMLFSGVSMMHPSSGELIQWGALYKPLVQEGEWWRMISCAFLHAGVLHLILNLGVLLLTGIFIEFNMSNLSLAITYLLSILGGSAASLWWNDTTVAVGASGAIFGILGCILVLALRNRFEGIERANLVRMVMIYIGINLVFGLSGGIDNAAHIGGLLTGGFCGFFVSFFKSPHKTN